MVVDSGAIRCESHCNPRHHILHVCVFAYSDIMYVRLAARCTHVHILFALIECILVQVHHAHLLDTINNAIAARP